MRALDNLSLPESASLSEYKSKRRKTVVVSGTPTPSNRLMMDGQIAIVNETLRLEWVPGIGGTEKSDTTECVAG